MFRNHGRVGCQLPDRCVNVLGCCRRLRFEQVGAVRSDYGQVHLSALEHLTLVPKRRSQRADYRTVVTVGYRLLTRIDRAFAMKLVKVVPRFNKRTDRGLSRLVSTGP